MSTLANFLSSQHSMKVVKDVHISVLVPSYKITTKMNEGSTYQIKLDFYIASSKGGFLGGLSRREKLTEIKPTFKYLAHCENR